MTPDTSSYLHAGYIVATTVYGLYIVSLLWRSRTARDIRTRTRQGKV